MRVWYGNQYLQKTKVESRIESKLACFPCNLTCFDGEIIFFYFYILYRASSHRRVETQRCCAPQGNDFPASSEGLKPPDERLPCNTISSGSHDHKCPACRPFESIASASPFLRNHNHEREKLAEKGASQDWSGVDLQRCIGHVIVTLLICHAHTSLSRWCG